MPIPVDAESLRSACAALLSANFSPDNRVKAIAQTAMEYLGACSIIVYARNRLTDELDIMAMPGVSQREVMRGPTDKLIFDWEDPSQGGDATPEEEMASINAREGVWLERDSDFDSYMAQLNCRSTLSARNKHPGSFRDRELGEQRRLYGVETGRLATAKIYLWKGVEQTYDHVGQMFVNFFVIEELDDAFTGEVRGLIRYVAVLIRELLVDKLYHSEAPYVHWSPERLLREINAAFDSIEAGRGKPDPGEAQVARIIRAAALAMTENYGGHAEVVFLTGRKLGRVFRDDADEKPAQIGLVKDEPATEAAVKDKKFYVRNKAKPHSSVGRQVEQDAPAEGYLPTLDPDDCKSVTLVPVVHDDEVRAVLCLSNPREGCFLDAQARAMQDLQQYARYSILRLDERRQRIQMSSALEFYYEMRFQGIEEPGVLMRGVVRALGAQWGTLWPIERGEPRIRRGIWFDADRHLDVPPDHPKWGIRLTGRSHRVAGFTQAMLGFADGNPGEVVNVILCMHVFPAASRRYHGTKPMRYLLQFLCDRQPGFFPGCWQELHDGFYQYAVTSDEPLPGFDPIEANPNTDAEPHTRIAFMVRDEQGAKAIVWLRFPGFHDIAWWERAYVNGLSYSLGKILQIHNLWLGIRSFRHLVPDVTLSARAEIDRLAKSLSTLDASALTLVPRVIGLDPHNVETIRRLWAERGKPIDNIRTYALTMWWKAAEVRSLLAPLTADSPGAAPAADQFSRLPLEELVDRAIAMATDFAPDRSHWVVVYGTGVDPYLEMSGLIYSALFNLCHNVCCWGWRGEVLENQHACIWIRRDATGGVLVCVGNSGKPVKVDPFNAPVSKRKPEGGVGLRTIRAVLHRAGGDMEFIPRKTFWKRYPDAPEELRPCITFFEFSVSNG